MDQYQYNKYISSVICDNIDRLFSALNIEMENCGKYYKSRCHIHDGDNDSALNIYPLGYTIRGYYKCNTHHCEEIFGKTILGFIRGVLSSQRKDWRSPEDTDKIVPWKDVNEFIRTLYDTSVDFDKVETKKELDATDFYHPPQPVFQVKLKREDIRKKLIIPSEFFLKRNYSAEIIDKYDIGLCNDPTKEMYNRIVVPIYDENYEYMVACVGRSKYPYCENCKYCHDPKVLCHQVKYKYVKWRNQKHCNSRDYLFNYWFAKKHIQQTKSVCIVESAGNVLRLEEAGIHNSIAIFGTTITDMQRITLEMSGAINALVIMDNDPNKAGQIGADSILSKLGKIMNVEKYFTKTNDIGDMTVKDVEYEIVPLVKKMEMTYE